MPFTATTPTLVGDFGLTEMPDSPLQREDGTKSSVTRKYNGTYEQARAGKPSIGDTYSDLAGDMVVVGSEVARSGGDKGILTVELETPYQTTYEVEWVEIDEDLVKNPRYWCTAAGDPMDGPKVLTLQDRSMIEKWEQEPDPAFRLVFMFNVLLSAAGTAGIGTGGPAMPTGTVTINGVTYNTYTLSDNATDYAKKRIKGEEAYRDWAPVLRETSESLEPPQTVKAGVVETPPNEAIDIYPSGYVWQRVAPRLTRTGPYGKYRLQREWQGALIIDTDLYPTPDS